MPAEQHPNVCYEVWADVREHLEASCDIGSCPASLAGAFPQIAGAFAHLPTTWWYVDEDVDTADPEHSRQYFVSNGFIEDDEVFEARVDAVKQQLLALPESRVAVFAHADFLNKFLERHCDQPDRWLSNGEVVEVLL